MSQFELGDFKRMMEALSSCIILHEAESKTILWANPAACKVLGFTLEELLPLKAPDMSSTAKPYARDIGRRWLHGAVLHGTNVIEWCYRTKQGDDILSEAIATLVHLAHQDVVMVQFRDIGREEQVKREMKRLESRLKEFMQDSNEGLAVLKADGTIEYLSDAGRKLLALQPEQPLPSFIDLCDRGSRPTLQALLQVALPDSISLPINYTVELEGGVRRWHQASCRHIAIENDLRGHLLHFRDITEQVEAEQARRRQQEALEYLARYNAMGEMATAIAHELSQPLAAIGNYLEGAQRRLRNPAPDHEQIAWGLRNAGRQVDHASTIITSVREYVVKLEQAEAMVDLNEILAEIRYFIELKAGEASVAVTLETAATPLLVSVERVLIGQVILNFAFNAIEEMLGFPVERRRISIHSEQRGNRAVLAVRDQGRGIDAELHQRLFDGFFTSKVGGNGIGLALCKNIIARHRGDIWAEPAAAGGTVFCFALPLPPPASDASGPVPPATS